MIAAGTLNRRITLQRRVDVQDDTGGIVSEWQPVATVWADIRYLSGLETVKADAPVSVAKASIRIRWRTDVDATCRVLHGATILDIKAVLPGEGSREYVDLACETGANDG